MSRYTLGGRDLALDDCNQWLTSSPTDYQLIAIDEFAKHLLFTSPNSAIELTTQRLQAFPSRVAGVAWSVLAAAYSQQGRAKLAAEACKKGLEWDIPKRMRINLYSVLSKYEDVSAELRKLIQDYDPLRDGVDTATKLLQLADEYAFWIDAQKLLAVLKDAYSNQLYATTNESPRGNLLWCDDQKINTGVARHMARRQFPEGQTTYKAEVTRLPNRITDEKIHIGYLSSDFRDHPTSHLMLGAWRNHNRDRFRITLFDSGWDDGSGTRKQIEKYCDELVPIAGLSDADAASEIKSRRVDVLVELNGPTQSHRLGVLRFKPAPVLIGYLGWPGSYGGELVDCIIGDRYTCTPSVAANIPETILYLDGTYQINDHRHYSVFSDGLGRITTSRTERSAFRFGSVNNINKLSLDVWDVWMHILKECPHSELHLLHPGTTAIHNIEQISHRYGIAASQFKWLPKLQPAEHLARLSELDLVLDPWPYGGHTTTTDALAAGVPVLALEGLNFAGRVSGSLLTAAGLGSLIAPTVQDYARMACALCENDSQMDQIREFMAATLGDSRLFDSLGRTRHLETLIEEVHHNACH